MDIHYARLARSTQTYRQLVLHSDPGCIVTLMPRTPLKAPASVHGCTILEPGAPIIWFTFPGEWHDIGLFHLADGAFTGVYANILTPVEPAGAAPRAPPDSGSARPGPQAADGAAPPALGDSAWATTDLCLDLWIGSAGKGGAAERAVLLDEDELDRAEEAGLASGAVAARARAEAEALMNRHRNGTWPPPVVREWSLERARATLGSAPRMPHGPCPPDSTLAAVAPREASPRTPG